MQKTTISLSFDDGRIDTYLNAYKIMKKYDLLGTVHVTTGYIDKSFTPNNWLTSDGPMTLDQIKKMKNYGFEISYHGDKHITEEQDFKTSITKMQEWQIAEPKMGFAVPGSDLSKVSYLKFCEFLKNNNVIYMRIDNNEICNKFINKVFRKLYRHTKNKFLYNLYNKNNTITTIDPYKLNSVVVFEWDKAKAMNYFIDKNVKKKNWIIFMLHGILDKNDIKYQKDPYAWDQDEFEILCQHLQKLVKEDKIEVKPIINVMGG